MAPDFPHADAHASAHGAAHVTGPLAGPSAATSLRVAEQPPAAGDRAHPLTDNTGRNADGIYTDSVLELGRAVKAAGKSMKPVPRSAARAAGLFAAAAAKGLAINAPEGSRLARKGKEWAETIHMKVTGAPPEPGASLLSSAAKAAGATAAAVTKSGATYIGGHGYAISAAAHVVTKKTNPTGPAYKTAAILNKGAHAVAGLTIAAGNKLATTMIPPHPPNTP